MKNHIEKINLSCAIFALLNYSMIHASQQGIRIVVGDHGQLYEINNSTHEPTQRYTQEELNAQLIKAAKEIDVSGVIKALANCADANSKDKDGYTALMRILRRQPRTPQEARNAFLIIDNLKDAGANFTMKDPSGRHSARDYAKGRLDELYENTKYWDNQDDAATCIEAYEKIRELAEPRP